MKLSYGAAAQPHPAAGGGAKPRSAMQGCRLQARLAGPGTPHPGEIIQIALRPVFRAGHEPTLQRAAHSWRWPSSKGKARHMCIAHQ